jgi:hypothetical protein
MEFQKPIFVYKYMYMENGMPYKLGLVLSLK